MARKLARELGIPLNTVRGTGPGGRITKDDVEAAAATAQVTVPAADIRADSQVLVDVDFGNCRDINRHNGSNSFFSGRSTPCG